MMLEDFSENGFISLSNNFSTQRWECFLQLILISQLLRLDGTRN